MFLPSLLGWIIVTIVGCLTAVFAFLVVTSERWLFSLKDGYCTEGWTKARALCCPQTELSMLFPTSTTETECQAWRPWSDLFAWDGGSGSIQFVAYTFIAVRILCYRYIIHD